MTSKERVTAALMHRESDRVPRFIWMGGEVRRRMVSKNGSSSVEPEIKIGNDILQTWVSINGEMERDVPQGTEFVDDFGITWKREGEYNMVIKNPLRGSDIEGINAYELPDPYSSSRFTYLENLINEYGNNYFIGADVSGVLFEPACHLRNMEDFLLDMAMENEEVDILLDKLTEFNISLSLECVKRGVDWIWMGDDLGSQQNMLMNVEMWRRYFKPRMKRIIDEIRTVAPGLPVAYHSCGSMAPVIEDLIEIGITVLNPVQESAAGMDQAAVKTAYGDRLSLMCGLDIQQFLNKATPNEVYEETKRKIESLGKNGGYIFATSHHIQSDTPEENINAMLEALK